MNRTPRLRRWPCRGRPGRRPRSGGRPRPARRLRRRRRKPGPATRVVRQRACGGDAIHTLPRRPFSDFERDRTTRRPRRSVLRRPHGRDAGPSSLHTLALPKASARFARLNHAIVKAIGDADARVRWYEGDYFGETFAPGIPRRRSPRKQPRGNSAVAYATHHRVTIRAVPAEGVPRCRLARVSVLLSVSCPFLHACAAGWRATDHDRRDSRVGLRLDWREPSRRERRGAQSRHQSGPHAGHRKRRPLRVPAAAAGKLPRDLHAVGLRDDGARERPPDGRPIDQPAGGDEGIRGGRNRDGHDGDAGHRHVADRGRDDDRPGDDRHDPDPRPQVRGPADAHARRQRRPGARRRRDLVCRPARHLQQHQPRRRRLQQRVLRRAGRRPARVD